MASAIEMVAENDELLTAKEAAALLRVEAWTIYELAKPKPDKQGKLQTILASYRLGPSRTLRFKRSDVLALLRPRNAESNP